MSDARPSAQSVVAQTQQVLATLAQMGDGHLLIDYLIAVGQELPPFPAAAHNAEHQVVGCISRVWLLPHIVGHNVVLLYAKSDSSITQGLAALIAQTIAGCDARDIVRNLDHAPFLASSLGQLIGPQRSNGLEQIVRHIRCYLASK